MLACVHIGGILSSFSDRLSHASSDVENKNEVVVKLQPKQKEAFEKSEILPVLFYGGAKGGGKSFLIRARQLIRRNKYPNTRGLILRKTYPELRANHISKFFQEYPITRSWYNKSEKTMYLPNGSTIEFSFLQNPDDVYTYQGREYDDIDIDEITQHEEVVFKILRTSNRTSNMEAVKAGMRPTMLLTGNPGGIGHQWVKRIFVDRQFKPEESPDDFGFVQAFVQDNRALLDADPNYVRQLEGLPENLRKAYLEGDWNIHAGQAFSELSTHVHLVEPFQLPAETRYFAGYDHGFNHPFAFVLFGVIPDGTVYVVKTVTARLKRPDEVYEMIRHACEGIGRVEIYAGLDLWSKQRDGSPSTAEQFISLGMTVGNGFTLIRAKVDRIQGVSEIRKWVAWKNTPEGRPKLFFFKNCIDAFNCVASMQFDSTNPEDVLKVDADADGLGGDDMYDACLVGDTKIQTLLGEKKIKDVKVGDWVLTRHSVFDEVVGSGETNNHAEIKTVRFSNGERLTGTGNHPIYILGKGFKPIDELRYGDIIYTWQQEPSFSTILHLETILNLVTLRIKGITRRVGIIRRRGWRIYTEKFGSPITEIFRRVMQSIILMETRIITIFPTLNLSRGKNTEKDIREAHQKEERTWKEYESRHLSGTDLKRGWPSIRNSPYFLGKIEKRKQGNVISAQKNTNITSLTADSVHRNVEQGREEKTKKTLRAGNVSFAEKILWLIYTVQLKLAPESVPHVLDIYQAGIDSVYNLSINNSHEYFANGVLVHNCRYGIMSRLRAPIIDQNKLAENSAQKILEDAIKRRQVMSSLNRWR